MLKPLQALAGLLLFSQLGADSGPVLALDFSQPSDPKIQLAEPAQAASLWRWEASSQLDGNWQTLAWTRPGQPWETLFPYLPHLSLADQVALNDPAIAPFLFFRITPQATPARSTRDRASRFLRQTTFGPKRAEIEGLVQTGLDYAAWIDAQISHSPTYHTTLAGQLDFDTLGGAHRKGIVWIHSALDAPDQLRQRMAWALSQIIVLGENGSQNRGAVDEFTRFYDLFVEHAFGNYRDLLGDVTMNPKMGRYLTYANNRKANARRLPDENYAREVMQLFTIGLWRLHPDGTPMLDTQGQRIPTYDNEHIETFARVFTGLVYAENQYEADMVVVESRHDTAAKQLLDGSWLPAGQDTLTDINALLDHLFEHPNTAPFISRLLIQRFTTSNPSPAYIGRVSAVFANNGAGVRGDLAATVRAILLDPEARDTTLLADDLTGRPEEPLLKLMQLARSFDLTLAPGRTYYDVRNLDQLINQHPYRSPSVFNFYLPDYQQQGAVTARGAYSPELEIINEVTLINFSNLAHRLIHDGLAREWNTRSTAWAELDLTYELGLAHDADALLDHLDCLLLAGALSDQNRALLKGVIEDTPASSRSLRLKRALSLLVLTPEFNTTR